MMGEQWGRTGNMKYFTPEEWVQKMDEEGVAAVCVPVPEDGVLPAAGDGLGHRARAHRRALRARAGPGLRARRHRPDVRDEGRQAPRAGDHRVRLRRGARAPVRLRHPDQRAGVVALLREVRRARRPGHLPGRPLRRVHAERVRQADPARRHRDLVPRAEARRRPHRLALDGGAHLDGVEAPERLHRRLRPRAEVLGPEARALPQLAQPRDREGHVGHRLPAHPAQREPRADRRARPQARGPAGAPARHRRRGVQDRRHGRRRSPRARTADGPRARLHGRDQHPGARPRRCRRRSRDGDAEPPREAQRARLRDLPGSLVAGRRARAARRRARRSSSPAPAAPSAPVPT